MKDSQKNKFSDIDIEKLKNDLNWLHGKIGYYLREDRLKGNDEELKRLWDLYEVHRNNLLELDSDLFSSLRKIDRPEPDLGYGGYYKEFGGLFSEKKDLIPLADEVYRATQYFSIYESKIRKVEYKPNSIANLKIIAKKFRSVSRQLLERYNERQTIEIDDEYDVQDLLQAMLTLFFDDIRKEEWAPSYAGGSSRMDFLLKNESIVVEVKKTRKGLDSKVVGEQLIIDIAKYKSHPSCKTLFCFVYDPEGKIANPRGIENDLSKPHDSLNVIVIIEPK
jgi:hypothetical protein